MVSRKVKIADFGVSGNIMNTMEKRSTFVGTALYMSVGLL